MSAAAGWPRRIAMAALVGAWAVPLAWMLVASLMPEADLFAGESIVPRRLTFEHYRALFDERQFGVPVRNSLIVAGATTALAILLGTPCAYALARLRVPGQRPLIAGILVISMFPQIAVVSPLFLVLRSIGLLAARGETVN